MGGYVPGWAESERFGFRPRNKDGGQVAEIAGPFIADVAGAGQASDGEIVYVTFVGTDGSRQPILFSPELIPRLMAAILSGGRLAAEARGRRADAIATAQTIHAPAIRIRKVEVGVAPRRGGGLDLVFRLHADEGVSFDIAMTAELADQLIAEIRQVARQVVGERCPATADARSSRMAANE